MAEIVAIVRETGALEATREAARDQVARAQAHLALLPESPWHEALLQLSADSIKRSS